MKDAGFWEPIIGQLLNPCPRETILLAASPERPPPEARDVGTKGRECAKVGRHRVIIEEAGNDLPQPQPLFGDRPVPASSHFLFDLLEFRRHAVATGLPFESGISPGATYRICWFNARTRHPSIACYRLKMTFNLADKNNDMSFFQNNLQNIVSAYRLNV
jgi:hypothetical protein